MTAPSPALESSDMLRWQAVASIVRKDTALLGPYALASGIGMFVMSAAVHTNADFHALLSSIGGSGSRLEVFLFGLLGVGLAVAVALFVMLLAQTNVASDTRHDWLIRPLNPLELVASKLMILICAIVAPMIVGDFIYMMMKSAPLEQTFASFPTILMCSVLALVVFWLVSTPFRAVLALLGTVVLLVAGIVFAEMVKIAIGYATTGARSDPTPFPNLDDSWSVSLVAGIGLYVASGATLWLLLAGRKPVTARWVFVGYLAFSTFLQHVLFNPI